MCSIFTYISLKCIYSFRMSCKALSKKSLQTLDLRRQGRIVLNDILLLIYNTLVKYYLQWSELVRLSYEYSVWSLSKTGKCLNATNYICLSTFYVLKKRITPLFTKTKPVPWPTFCNPCHNLLFWR